MCTSSPIPQTHLACPAHLAHTTEAITITSTLLVPLGGQTVPKGMEAHADWKALPEAPTDAAETDYGPEYNRLMELRTFFGDLKKVPPQIFVT